MRCEDFERRVDEWVDGDLELAAAAEMERHIEACDDCRGIADALTAVIRAAHGLSDRIEPRRDLWPGIAARLVADGVVRPRFDDGDRAARPSRPWRAWLAVAAALLVTAVVAYQAGRQRPPVVADNPVPRPEIQRAALTMDGGVDAELREVRDDLRARLAARRDALDPATLEVVDDNLAVIDDAISRITSALDNDPGNGRLTRQLVFAYRQQIDLLRRAAEAPREL